MLASPSVVLAAKCGASQQHKEIQPGRQLQSHISMLEKMHSRAWRLCSDACQAHPRSGHTCAGFHSRDAEWKQESCVSHSVSNREHSAIVCLFLLENGRFSWEVKMRVHTFCLIYRTNITFYLHPEILFSFLLNLFCPVIIGYYISRFSVIPSHSHGN